MGMKKSFIIFLIICFGKSIESGEFDPFIIHRYELATRKNLEQDSRTEKKRELQTKIKDLKDQIYNIDKLFGKKIHISRLGILPAYQKKPNRNIYNDWRRSQKADQRNITPSDILFDEDQDQQLPTQKGSLVKRQDSIDETSSDDQEDLTNSKLEDFPETDMPSEDTPVSQSWRQRLTSNLPGMPLMPSMPFVSLPSLPSLPRPSLSIFSNPFRRKTGEGTSPEAVSHATTSSASSNTNSEQATTSSSWRNWRPWGQKN